MLKTNAIVAVSIALAVTAVVFYFSFTEFEVELTQQEVVSGEQVFVSTDKVAVDKFIEEFGTDDPTDENTQQKFGIAMFVDFRDSSGKVIPEGTNFLNIPLTETNLNTASLIGEDGELLDFADIQFDFLGITAKDDFVEVSVDYEILSNGVVFLQGTAFANGMTSNNKINLDFSEGDVIGDAVQLSFENGDIPVEIVEGEVVRNVLEIRLKKVETLIGSDFETRYYKWLGSFPIYSLRYDADPSTITVFDYTGKAITSLPMDVSIQSCGQNNGRIDYGSWDNKKTVDTPRVYPIITVQDDLDRFILTSSNPTWGTRDADFGAVKCGSIVGGLERDADYRLTVTTNRNNFKETIPITTPLDPFNYKITCSHFWDGKVKLKCTSNFNWEWVTP